ncbi:MAG: amidohydrolase family protein [Candidatus Rokuibacteriota bacterium]
MPILIRGGRVLTEAQAAPAAVDVLVDGDRVARVGADLPAAPGTRVIEARGRLVIPGLVNGHTHAHNVLAKGAIDGLPLEIWVQYLAARVANRTPRDIYVGAAIGAIEMLRTGTTCACDMAQVTPWPTDEGLDAVARAYVDVGLRVSIAAQVFDLSFVESLAGLEAALPADLRAAVVRPRAYPTAEVLATVRGAIARWHGAADGRVRFGVGPNLITLCSEAFLEECGALSRAGDLTLQTHLSETKAEAYTARQRYGMRAAEKLAALGLLGPRTLLAHSVWLDERELDLIADAGAMVAHNPVSNLKLGAGIAPVAGMRRRGITVALGTDGAASNDNQNMFYPLRLAAILPRVVDPEYADWPGAADALRMATVDGARAAGFADRVGRIAPGWKADLTVLDLGSSYFHPANDLVRQLVYCEVGSSVRTVLVDGRVVLDEGRVTTVDEAALLAEADEVGRRVAAEMEGRAADVRRLEPYVRRAYLAANRAEWPVNHYASEAYRALPAE